MEKLARNLTHQQTLMYHSPKHRLRIHKEKRKAMGNKQKHRGKENINKSFFSLRVKKASKKKNRKTKKDLAQFSGYILNLIPTKNIHSSQVL